MPASQARPRALGMAMPDTGADDAPLRTLSRGLQVIELLQASDGLGFLLFSSELRSIPFFN